MGREVEVLVCRVAIYVNIEVELVESLADYVTEVEPDEVTMVRMGDGKDPGEVKTIRRGITCCYQ